MDLGDRKMSLFIEFYAMNFNNKYKFFAKKALDVDEPYDLLHEQCISYAKNAFESVQKIERQDIIESLAANEALSWFMWIIHEKFEYPEDIVPDMRILVFVIMREAWMYMDDLQKIEAEVLKRYKQKYGEANSPQCMADGTPYYSWCDKSLVYDCVMELGTKY